MNSKFHDKSKEYKDFVNELNAELSKITKYRIFDLWDFVNRNSGIRMYASDSTNELFNFISLDISNNKLQEVYCNNIKSYSLVEINIATKELENMDLIPIITILKEYKQKIYDIFS